MHLLQGPQGRRRDEFTHIKYLHCSTHVLSVQRMGVIIRHSRG